MKHEGLSALANNSIFFGEGIVSTDKFNYDDIIKKVPGCEKARDALGRDGLKNKTIGPLTFRVAILDYLGDQGWELVSQGDGIYYLKRIKAS